MVKEGKVTHILHTSHIIRINVSPCSWTSQACVWTLTHFMMTWTTGYSTKKCSNWRDLISSVMCRNLDQYSIEFASISIHVQVYVCMHSYMCVHLTSSSHIAHTKGMSKYHPLHRQCTQHTFKTSSIHCTEHSNSNRTTHCHFKKSHFT